MLGRPHEDGIETGTRLFCPRSGQRRVIEACPGTDRAGIGPEAPGQLRLTFPTGWYRLPNRMATRSSIRRQRIEAFEALCRRHGLPITIQRRTIFAYVAGREDHPTADQIYGAVRKRIPGVSRTTVYRVLETLVRLGVLSKACHPGSPVRFDPKVDRHHHLVCVRCGKMTDVADARLNGIELPAIANQGYEIRDFSIHFQGTCPACRRKTRKGGASRIKTTEQRSPSATKGKRTQSLTRKRRQGP